MMTALDTLIKSLTRLPGIGPKSASRMAYHLIKTDKSYNLTLAEAIATIGDPSPRRTPARSAATPAGTGASSVWSKSRRTC